MGREKHLRIPVDSLTVAWLAARARRRGTSLSEYVRGLIVRDLDRTADGNAVAPAAVSSTDHPTSDTLGDYLLELSVLTTILVRAQISLAFGEDEARSIETRAKRKAKEQVKLLLSDLRAASKLEPGAPFNYAPNPGDRDD